MKRQRPSEWNAKKGGFKKPRTAALSQEQKMEVDREVKRTIARKTDYKTTDTVVTPASVGSSGTTKSLFDNLVRGDLGKDNFDGDNITPKWVRVRYSVNTAASAADSYNQVRVIIFQSKLLGTASPGGVLDLSATSGTVSAPLSQRLEDRLKDYKVLYDHTHCVNNSGNQQEFADVFIKGSRLTQVDFTSTGTLSITRGDIAVLYISDDGVADNPDFNMYARVKFSD